MDQKYQNYLNSIHAASSISDKMIAELVKAETGEEVRSKERIVAGEVNEVYRLTVSDGKSFILRIAKGDSDEFKIESWVIDQVRAIGVPTPSIIAITQKQTQTGTLSFCLMEEIVGQPLERGTIHFHELALEDQKKLLAQSGQILSKIHSVSCDGFGPFLQPGKSEYQKSFANVTEYLGKQEKMLQIADKVHLDAATINKAVDLLDHNQDALLTTDPRLNHGDYGPKHIMVSESEITGIIDWGLARSDSPLSDLANWDYWFDDYPMKWLLSGYEDTSLFDSSFNTKIHLYRIMKGLDVLEWYYEQHFQDAVAKAVVKLVSDVQYFD